MSGIKRSRISRLTGLYAKSTTRQGGGEQSAPMADLIRDRPRPHGGGVSAHVGSLH